MLNGSFQKISTLYHEYPRTFWVVIAFTFIDRLGGSLLFPFFALYITSKFHVGMTDIDIHTKQEQKLEIMPEVAAS